MQRKSIVSLGGEKDGKDKAPSAKSKSEVSWGGTEKVPLGSYVDDAHNEDTENLPKFIKMFWLQYKLIMILFNTLLLMLCGVCMICFIFLYWNGEEPFLNRYQAMEMRNFSILVPIWGAFGNNALGSWLDVVYFIMLGMGLLYGALGVMGVFTFRSSCYSTEETSYTFHKYYVLLNFLCLVIFIVIGVSAAFGDSIVHANAKEALLDALKKKYTIMGEDSAFTQAMNIMMITGDCCGVYGPEDFSREVNLNILIDKKNSSYKFAPDGLYWPDTRDRVLFKIPPACCKKATFKEGTKQYQYNEIKECALMNYSTKRANTIGCFQAFINIYKEAYGKIGIAVLSTLILMQLYVTAVCVCRCLQHLDCSDEYIEEGEDVDPTVVSTEQERRLLNAGEPAQQPSTTALSRSSAG